MQVMRVMRVMRVMQVTVVALMVSACNTQAPPLNAPSYDVVITNARIVDGTGGAARTGSIAIAGGKIAAVGEVGGNAAQTIDARGRTVAPGFIDMHSHSDMPLITDGNGQSKIRQGVTTEVIGESGSVAPRKASSATQPWVDFSGYFAALEKNGISPNVLSYVGSGTVRELVIGEEDKKATPKDIEEMQKLVSAAMDQGVFGMSSGLIYPPNAYATVTELGEVAKAAQGGLYASHVRYDGAKLREGIEEAIAIGERGGIPVHVFHIKVTGE
jgi:N-acyl-D-aspartate/D-glutamate deacylase